MEKNSFILHGGRLEMLSDCEFGHVKLMDSAKVDLNGYKLHANLSTLPEEDRAWPPRVWIHTLDRKSVVPVHALIHFEPENEHHEYISAEEHAAIVKELEAKLAGTEFELSSSRHAQKVLISMKNGLQDQLTEAQAEIERLRGALEFTLGCTKNLLGNPEEKGLTAGMSPMFYHTLSYEGDMELRNKYFKAKQALAEGKDDGGRDGRN